MKYLNLLPGHIYIYIYIIINNDNNFNNNINNFSNNNNNIMIIIITYSYMHICIHNSKLRLRIEHAQILSPADVPRFALLNVIPSMQPTHLTSDMIFVENKIGKDRMMTAYAWKLLLKRYVLIYAQ